MPPPKKYYVFALDGINYGYNPVAKCHFATDGEKTVALTGNEYRHMLTKHMVLTLRT